MLLRRSAGWIPRVAIRPRLIAITDAARIGVDSTLGRARVLLGRARSGSVQVQLRDRALDARARLELGRRLLELTRATGHTLCVNDRADLAALLGADALHLGDASIRAAEARSVLGPEIWISRAWHPGVVAETPEDLADLDALVISPALAPRKGNPRLGIDGLVRARRVLAGVRMYALGGVDASNASECLRAGADGVAAIGAVFDSDPEPLLEALGIAGP